MVGMNTAATSSVITSPAVPEWLHQRWQLSAPPAQWVVLAALALVCAGCAAKPVWVRLRYAETIVHEMGHVVVALLFGRRVLGIRVNRDSSGCTTTTGGHRWIGVLASTLAGYPAPPTIGLALVWAVVSGYSGAALIGLDAVLVVALLLVRNLFGLLIVGGTLGASGLVLWRDDPAVVTAFVVTVGLFLVVTALRESVTLASSHHRGEGAESDASALARLTWIPATVWVLVFTLVSVACAVQVGALLLAAAR